jgi:hypothetical protein
MPSNGSCSIDTCRSRRWQSSPHRRARLRQGKSHARLDHSRKTDCGVDGTYAQRSAVTSRSSPCTVHSARIVEC